MNSHFDSDFQKIKDSLFRIKSSEIFHYTDIQGLFYIISSGYMIASHLKFLNDWKEFDIGYERLVKSLKNKISEKQSDNFIKGEIGKLPEKSPSIGDYGSFLQTSDNHDVLYYFRTKILPDVFALSFCFRGDSLNHWITYAKEEGVSIEFDFSNFTFYDFALEEKRKDLIKDKLSEYDIYEVMNFNNSFPRIIKYIHDGDKKIDKALGDFVDLVIRDYEGEKDLAHIKPSLWNSISELINIVPFLKTAEFEDEREVRIAFREKEQIVQLDNFASTNLQTIVNYRLRNNLIIPYLKIGWRKKEPKDKLLYPIKSITVGPGKNQSAIFDSIINFIERQDKNIIPVLDENSHGFYDKKTKIFFSKQGIKIKLSKTPYIF